MIKKIKSIEKSYIDKLINGKGLLANIIKITFFPFALILMVLLASIFNKIAVRIQTNTFANADSILFIPGYSNNLAGIAVLISFIALIFIWMIFKFNFYTKKMNIIFNIIVLITLIGNILYFMKSSYDYIDITNGKIIIREKKESPIQSYGFDEISYVEVTYRTHKTKSGNNYHYVYRIHMKNGMTFDAADSYEFTDKIAYLDDTFQKYNIRIDRNSDVDYFLNQKCRNYCSPSILKIYGISESEYYSKNK